MGNVGETIPALLCPEIKATAWPEEVLVLMMSPDYISSQGKVVEQDQKVAVDIICFYPIDRKVSFKL